MLGQLKDKVARNFTAHLNTRGCTTKNKCYKCAYNYHYRVPWNP